MTTTTKPATTGQLYLTRNTWMLSFHGDTTARPQPEFESYARALDYAAEHDIELVWSVQSSGGREIARVLACSSQAAALSKAMKLPAVAAYTRAASIHLHPVVVHEAT